MLSPSFFAIMRAAASAAPPAAKPTTKEIDFLGGNVCACTDEESKPIDKAAIAKQEKGRKCMMLLLGRYKYCCDENKRGASSLAGSVATGTNGVWLALLYGMAQ